MISKVKQNLKIIGIFHGKLVNYIYNCIGNFEKTVLSEEIFKILIQALQNLIQTLVQCKYIFFKLQINDNSRFINRKNNKESLSSDT